MTLSSTFIARNFCLVLLEVLGLLKTPLCGRTSPASPLVPHCLVVGIDTEAWTSITDEVTEIEIEIVVAEYKARKELEGNFGDYAESVLKKMKYHHLRVWENAHLKTNVDRMRDPEGNRFGRSRFVTFAEAREVLDDIFDQPIVSNDLNLADMKRPVVLLEHAVTHDKENLENFGL
jgi:hypothetical protein